MTSRFHTYPKTVLFLDRDNGPRSLIAEAVVNAEETRHFVAYSAGIEPANGDRAEVRAVLARHGLSGNGMRGKSWTEFARPNSPELDFVIVTDDRSVAALRPIWNGHPTRIVWELPDPADMPCGSRERLDTTYRLVRSCLSLFLSMPHTMLDRMAVDDPSGLDIDRPALSLLERSARPMAVA